MLFSAILRCRYNEECTSTEICVNQLCQRKVCSGDEECKALTKYPSK